MDSLSIISLVTFIYGISVMLYVAAWIFRSRNLGTAATAVMITGFIGTGIGIILRWIESYQMGIGHAPLSNLYESLVFFAWSAAGLYLYVEYRYQKKSLGVFASPLIFLSIAYASLSPEMSSEIKPLIPALKSDWLIAHVFTCFLGYAGFTVAFGASLMYLLKSDSGKEDGGRLFDAFPEPEILDELTHQMIMFGFLFLTVGIITGSVWANSAWGTYWSWDPKETWSLITWFIYAIILHVRMMRGWQGKGIAVFSIFGFISVMFTYFGVNYLPGLHSYGV